MQTTGNLGLKKPEGTDIVDIADMNGNMDILDNAVNGKVDKVTGKQLSTNDYTAAEKTKLAGIATGANNYVHPNHTGDVISTGDGVTAIAPGVIVDADVNVSAGIAWSKVSKTGASLADLSTRSAGDLSSGTLPVARLPAATGDVTSPAGSSVFTLSAGIQGQINSKAPLATTPQQTTADITYYVRTDGNDNNNGLANTAAGAFKTINKAVSMIPQIVNHTINIIVAAGTYSDDIYLGGKSGSGEVKITGASSLVTTHVTTGMSAIRNSCRIVLTGLVFSQVKKNPIFSCAEVVLAYCTISSAANDVGFFVDSSKAYFTGCSVSNRNPAFQAHTNSEVLIQICSGSGNGYAVTAAYGGRVVLDAVTITSTNKYSIYSGGIIIDNNSGILNPWGDNTPTNRTGIFAGKGVAQSIPTNVWTKVVFPGTSYDHLNEFNKTTSTFTAKQKGMYLVNASVFLDSVPAGFSAQLRIYLNGGTNIVVNEAITERATSLLVKGSVAMYMDAGHTLELYVYTIGQVTTINLANDVTAFQINRIA